MEVSGWGWESGTKQWPGSVAFSVVMAGPCFILLFSLHFGKTGSNSTDILKSPEYYVNKYQTKKHIYKVYLYGI